MAVKRQSLPKKYEKMQESIFNLVSKRGVSKTICLNKFQLPANYFNRYVGADENFNSGMAEFASGVLMKSVVETLELDGAGRKYIMQKLRVFDQPMQLPVPKMKTAKDASENLSFALDQYAQKHITSDALQDVRQACEVYSKLSVATVLQDEVQELRQLFEEKFNKGV